MNFRESYFEFKSYQGGYAREAGLHLLTGDCRENCASALTKNWVSLIVFIIAGTFLGKVVGGPWRASAGAWWDLAAARREVECLRLELGVGGAGAGPRASYCKADGIALQAGYCPRGRLWENRADETNKLQMWAFLRIYSVGFL